MRQPQKPQHQKLSRASILLLATIAGTIAALLAYVCMARQTQGAQAKPVRPLLIVTAACNLPPRTVLSASQLRLVSWNQAACPPGAITNLDTVSGDVTTQEIAAQQPLTKADVTVRSAVTGLAPQIAPSMRAVSIPLDPSGGAVGFLEPGDHVDVLATFSLPNGQSVARLIVPNAQLLALSIGSQNSPATGAVLEVSPHGAQALALASAHGRLTLALRGLGDDEDAPLPALPSAAVTGEEAAPPVPASAPLPRLSVVPAAHSITQPVGKEAPLVMASGPAPLPQITVVRGTVKTLITVGQ